MHEGTVGQKKIDEGMLSERGCNSLKYKAKLRELSRQSFQTVKLRSCCHYGTF